MELVVERNNLLAALKRVERNKGGAGVDGMSTQELRRHLAGSWPQIREQLLDGTYRPMPVKRVSIPKPDGGTRDLGVPTVVDRFIQQALLQVLQPVIDPTFSEHSHGFRPGRSAHGALREALSYVRRSKTVVVDVDLAKFFDRANHDVLMGRVARHISDKRVLSVIRRFLEAGVMVEGITLARGEGTPQGGPLSPLLANILLDDVDKELERRGHSFVRYADDLNVYVWSRRAGERVMSLLRRLFSSLRLQVNEEKSAVGHVSERKFLGFTIGRKKGVTCGLVSPSSLKRFKDRVREETNPTRGRSLAKVIDGLREWLPGWRNYYGVKGCHDEDLFVVLDAWIRRRLRALALRHWRRPRVIYAELLRHGVRSHWATIVARRARSYWENSRHSAMHIAFPNRFFDRAGLPRLST